MAWKLNFSVQQISKIGKNTIMATYSDSVLSVYLKQLPRWQLQPPVIFGYEATRFAQPNLEIFSQVFAPLTPGRLSWVSHMIRDPHNTPLGPWSLSRRLSFSVSLVNSWYNPDSANHQGHCCFGTVSPTKLFFVFFCVAFSRSVPCSQAVTTNTSSSSSRWSPARTHIAVGRLQAAFVASQ